MAKLHKITFTGADNETSIDQMVELCKKYPFIEFGILIKNKIWGDHSFEDSTKWKARFPSIRWIHELLGRFTTERLTNHLSLHICPPLTYELMEDIKNFRTFGGFKRIQLNSKPKLFNLQIHNNLCPDLLNPGSGDPQLIFQFNGDKPIQRYTELLSNLERTCAYYRHIPAPESLPIVGLFDMSGGRGSVPDHWQIAPKSKLPLLIGYAGGLNPFNLKENIDKIMEVAGNNYVWLDMETGVRNEAGQFDVDKVTKCCEIFEDEVKL